MSENCSQTKASTVAKLAALRLGGVTAGEVVHDEVDGSFAIVVSPFILVTHHLSIGLMEDMDVEQLVDKIVIDTRNSIKVAK